MNRYWGAFECRKVYASVYGKDEVEKTIFSTWAKSEFRRQNEAVCKLSWTPVTHREVDEFEKDHKDYTERCCRYQNTMVTATARGKCNSGGGTQVLQTKRSAKERWNRWSARIKGGHFFFDARDPGGEGPWAQDGFPGLGASRGVSAVLHRHGG